MKYSRFEDFPVWKAAIEFALNVFDFTNRADLKGLGDTKNQLERAALSISNNIAEGFERDTTADLIYFLYVARGSAGESRSILRMCEGLRKFSDLRSEISNLINRAFNISKQLHGWIESLKKTDIKGVKFLTNKTRQKIEQDKEFADFDREMERYKQELNEKLMARDRENIRRQGDENENSI